MDRDEALARLAEARVGHLATVRPNGKPHLVPITFAVVEGSIVTAIDHKPKTTRDLQRLENIEANPFVSVLADHYAEDWEGLWWVRVDGRARVHDNEDAPPGAIAALVAKYAQYGARPPRGPVIVITPEKVTFWEGAR